MKILLEIITPERLVFSEEVDQVTLPTVEGEITILPGHIPLFSKINPGEITLRSEGKEEYLAVTGGFLEVTGKKATILADYAVRSQEIEVAKAEAAKKRAEEAMSEKKSQSDFVMAEVELRKALIELKVAQRRRALKIRLGQL